MKITTLLLLALIMAGCENGQLVLSDEARQAEQDKVQKQGAVRRETFIQCMELAAMSGRQGDDDVSDIVESCSSYAKSLTYYVQ